VAYDGFQWSDPASLSVSGPTDHAPIVTDGNDTVEVDNMIDASLLFNVNDADGDAITEYQFKDLTAGAHSGFFIVDHVIQPANKAIDVTAQKLAQFIASFQGGSAPGIDQIAVRAMTARSGAPGTRSRSRPIQAAARPSREMSLASHAAEGRQARPRPGLSTRACAPSGSGLFRSEAPFV
jgi:hypothetical protein